MHFVQRYLNWLLQPSHPRNNSTNKMLTNTSILHIQYMSMTKSFDPRLYVVLERKGPSLILQRCTSRPIKRNASLIHRVPKDIQTNEHKDDSNNSEYCVPAHWNKIHTTKYLWFHFPCSCSMPEKGLDIFSWTELVNIEKQKEKSRDHVDTRTELSTYLSVNCVFLVLRTHFRLFPLSKGDI